LKSRFAELSVISTANNIILAPASREWIQNCDPFVAHANVWSHFLQWNWLKKKLLMSSTWMNIWFGLTL